MDYADDKIAQYFPESVRDECLEAYREGQSDMKEARSGLTEEEVRVDEARKARWTYQRQQ